MVSVCAVETDNLQGKGMVGGVVDQKVLKELLKIYMPTLHDHLTTVDFPTELITQPWFLCLFIGYIPMQVSTWTSPSFMRLLSARPFICLASVFRPFCSLYALNISFGPSIFYHTKRTIGNATLSWPTLSSGCPGFVPRCLGHLQNKLRGFTCGANAWHDHSHFKITDLRKSSARFGWP